VQLIGARRRGKTFTDSNPLTRLGAAAVLRRRINGTLRIPSFWFSNDSNSGHLLPAFIAKTSRLIERISHYWAFKGTKSSEKAFVKVAWECVFCAQGVLGFGGGACFSVSFTLSMSRKKCPLSS